ncbi:MAG: hypothetical protein ACRC9N_12080 [Aeromonas sp.]
MKSIDKSAVCGRFFSAIQCPTSHQLAVLAECIDGLSEQDLSRCQSDAKVLAKIPLNHASAMALSEVNRLLCGKVNSVMAFTSQQRAALTADIQHLYKTDC